MQFIVTIDMLIVEKKIKRRGGADICDNQLWAKVINLGYFSSSNSNSKMQGVEKEQSKSMITW